MKPARHLFMKTEEERKGDDTDVQKKFKALNRSRNMEIRPFGIRLLETLTTLNIGKRI